MGRHFPINEQKYIDLLRYAEPGDKLEHAFGFIDEVIECFIKHGMTHSSH